MVNIQELVSDFSFDCFIPLTKGLISFFREKHTIILVSHFMNTKEYKTKVPTSTNNSRFNDLVTELITLVKENGLLNQFINNNQFYETLLIFMKNQYDNLSDTFLKGSYSKMIDTFNRIINPKKNDEDDEDDPLDELKVYIKNYSPEIINHISNFKLYFREISDDTDDYNDIYVKIMIDFYEKGISVFGIYSNKKSLWCFIDDNQIDKSQFTNISVDKFMECLQKDTYIMNSVHYTTLDTIKRDYIAKSFDLIKIHIKMIPSLKFYEGLYKNNDDMNELNELQLRNTIQGFPNGFDDDVSKNCMVIFKFNGYIGNLDLVSYWITKKPIENILNNNDLNAFIWKDIDETMFISNIMSSSTIGTSCLH